MNPENTLPIGVRIDSAQWLAVQVPAVRCMDKELLEAFVERVGPAHRPPLRRPKS